MAATIAIAACSKDAATDPQSAAAADDYALVMFGSSGAALQGTLGPQMGRPFDGRTGDPEFPDSLRLTDDQKAAIQALRTDFQTAHQSDLDALKAIFARARAAHDAGATRDDIRTILQEGRPIGEALQSAVDALHTAIRAVLTDAQVAWLQSHCPPPPPDVNGRGRPDDRRPPGPPHPPRH